MAFSNGMLVMSSLEGTLSPGQTLITSSCSFCWISGSRAK